MFRPPRSDRYWTRNSKSICSKKIAVSYGYRSQPTGWNVADFGGSDVDADFLSDFQDLAFGAHEDGQDHSGGGFECALQRSLVTGMGHGGRDRSDSACCCDQLAVFLVPAQRWALERLLREADVVTI